MTKLKKVTGFRLQVIVLIAAFFVLATTYNLQTTTLLAQQPNLISITPSSGDLKTGDEKYIALQINSVSKISGFDLKFNTEGPLSIVDFSDNLSFSSVFDPFNSKQVSEDINGTNSKVAFVFTGPAGVLPQSATLYIKVKGNANGQGKINLDYNNSQILDGNGQILQVPPLSAGFNLNQNQTSEGFIDGAMLPKTDYPSTTAVVNLKLKLAGVDQNSKITSLKGTALTGGRTGEGNYQTRPQQFDLIPNPDGTLSGTVAFPDFKDGNKFYMILKADKYLLRNICTPDPSEDKYGAYQCTTPSLTIRQGENSFDFSKISILPGDLGATDGVLNGYDLSIVRNNLGKDSKEALALADLNYDGVVDIKDFEIITEVARNSKRESDQ